MMATKNLAIIGLVATLAVVGAVLAAVIIAGNTKNKDQNDDSNVNTSQKAIQTLCQNTYYQQTCTETLSNATNSSDPQTLVKTIFEIAITNLDNAIEQSSPLQKIANDPKTAYAYNTCKKVLDDSIEDLRKTIERTESFHLTDFSIFIDDIKTWLTGALTYQETCLDSFEDTNGENAEKMRQLLKLSRELTINGLALANEFHQLILPSGLPFGTNKRQLADRQKPLLHGGNNNSRKLLQLASNGVVYTPNVVVAKDGSGKYKTISEALHEVPHKSNETFVIYVKEGVYEEYVTITSTMWSVMLLGDGPTKTRITGNKSYGGGVGTYYTATVGIDGDNFIGKNIGIENTAGATMYQAVALRVSADKTIFYNCHIDGYQDTLYAHNHRQYYRDCTISGTIDFIFGNARAVIQNCTLLVRKPLDNQNCIVTANGRTASNETSAFVIHASRIVAAPEYPAADAAGRKAYLGRPWKDYSTTIFVASEMDGLISPEGWSPWDEKAANIDTCWYAEVGCTGPGADLKNRVKWPGIKSVTTAEAEEFAPGNYMGGAQWIQGKGVPFDSGFDMIISN